MIKNKQHWIQLQDDPVDVGAAADFLRTPRAGGIDLFLGTTRQWTGADETVELAYEAYAPMALREMQALCDQAQERWAPFRTVLIHRLGVVPPAEVSVLIGVATAHRAAAFETCRWLIDTLKRQVPIWKRERYRDGRTEWIQGTERPDVHGD